MNTTIVIMGKVIRFHEKSSNQIQKDLKNFGAEFYQNQRETLGDVWRQKQRDGLKATWSTKCGIRCAC